MRLPCRSVPQIVRVGVTKGDLHVDVERGGARKEVSDWSEEAAR